MTEAEKKAIAYLRFYSNDDKDEYFDKTFKIDKFFCKKILNLIEKLQKENEELKKNQRYKKDNIFSLEYDKETLRDMVLEKQEEIKELKSNSIPKDKIREKMQEIMNYTYSTADERHNQDYAYDRLKELLEEE